MTKITYEDLKRRRKRMWNKINTLREIIKLKEKQIKDYKHLLKHEGLITRKLERIMINRISKEAKGDKK